MLTPMFRKQGSFQIYNSLTPLIILCLLVVTAVSLIIVRSSNAQTQPKQEGVVQSEQLIVTQTVSKLTQPSQEQVAEKGNEGKCEVSGNFPEKITQWCSLITKQANKNNLDPDLVAALIWQESGGQKDAYSKSGAVGLMQVMPRDGVAASFMCVNGPCFASRPSMEELYKPIFNVKYGTNFLGNLVKNKGSVREALFRYGPTGGGYYYADKVLGIYNKYKE